MNVSLYQAAAAMNANARWQELITENLSTGTVPGYRKMDVSFSAVQAGLDPTAATPGGLRYYIPSANFCTNFQPGENRPTNNLTDFAIEGPGFFEVQMPNGTRAYTRDGEFRFDGQGQLVTKQGYLVLGDGGPLVKDPNSSAPLAVSETGEVSQGDQVRGRMRLVEFKQVQSLTPIGQGYFLAEQPASAQPLAATGSTVRQGFLESSNASPTAEMATLITSMRMFETNQRVLQAQDERMGRVISELGGS
jgi:flagellar basal-body rod protein FlgF